jgi:EAL domain-containing protein (putative c-di-GMP-specific phosphodiesterase class I)
VSPDVFIPAAEASGLIVKLGYWAMRQACLAWLRLSDAGHALPLSVNVSPSQFRERDFVAQVRAILRETGAPATQLIFEVTEGLLIENLDDTIARMHELAQLGIRFSIDDFGTGYSNLAYLKRMPLYELKIDRSFINDTPDDANDTAIVQSILAMAAHLGLRVVAEGVETQAQAAFLAANGAPGMQGYLFARPMPLQDMLALLERTAREPAITA